jgi:hypothetical protein
MTEPADLGNDVEAELMVRQRASAVQLGQDADITASAIRVAAVAELVVWKAVNLHRP